MSSQPETSEELDAFQDGQSSGDESDDGIEASDELQPSPPSGSASSPTTDSPTSPDTAPSPQPSPASSSPPPEQTRPRRETKPAGTKLVSDVAKLLWLLEAFPYLTTLNMEELSTTVPGMILASFDSEHHQPIVAHILADELQWDSWLACIPTDVKWASMRDMGDSLMRGDDRLALVPGMVQSMRTLGWLVDHAIRSPATQHALPWIFDTEYYHTCGLVALLFQRLHDATPIPALEAMRGAGTSGILQSTDSAFEAEFLKSNDDPAMYSITNLNKAAYHHVLGPISPIINFGAGENGDTGFRLDEIFEVMMRLGVFSWDLILIWLSWKCPKHRYIWNLLRLQRGVLLHVVTNPFHLNLPFIMMMLSGHLMVASRAGHHYVGGCPGRRLGPSGPVSKQRAQKVQLFVTTRSIEKSMKRALCFCTVATQELLIVRHDLGEGGSIVAAAQHVALWRWAMRMITLDEPRREIIAVALALARQSTSRDVHDRAPKIPVPAALLLEIRQAFSEQLATFEQQHQECVEQPVRDETSDFAIASDDSTVAATDSGDLLSGEGASGAVGGGEAGADAVGGEQGDESPSSGSGSVAVGVEGE